jgi:hypothetical protein
MHVKLEAALKDHKDLLDNRLVTYEEQSKRGNWLMNSGILLAILGAFLYPIGTSLTHQEPVLILALSVFLLIFGCLLAILGLRINDKRGIPRQFTGYFTIDERIFLKLFESLTALEGYLNSEPKEGHQDYRKSEPLRYQGLKYMRETHDLLDAEWRPTNIGVVMKTIGEDMEDFKQEFERSLINTVEFGSKRENVVVFDILTEFAEFLMNPDKGGLVILNANIKKRQEENLLLRSDKPHPCYPIIDSLLRYRVPQHSMIFAIILLSSFFIAYVGWLNWHIDVNTAYMVFATLSSPLLAVYFGYMLKRPRT